MCRDENGDMIMVNLYDISDTDPVDILGDDVVDVYDDEQGGDKSNELGDLGHLPLCHWPESKSILSVQARLAIQYRVGRMVAEKVLFNIVLYVPPITVVALQSS